MATSTISTTAVYALTNITTMQVEPAITRQLNVIITTPTSTTPTSTTPTLTTSANPYMISTIVLASVLSLLIIALIVTAIRAKIRNKSREKSKSERDSGGSGNYYTADPTTTTTTTTTERIRTREAEHVADMGAVNLGFELSDETTTDPSAGLHKSATLPAQLPSASPPSSHYLPMTALPGKQIGDQRNAKKFSDQTEYAYMGERRQARSEPIQRNRKKTTSYLSGVMTLPSLPQTPAQDRRTTYENETADTSLVARAVGCDDHLPMSNGISTDDPQEIYANVDADGKNQALMYEGPTVSINNNSEPDLNEYANHEEIQRHLSMQHENLNREQEDSEETYEEPLPQRPPHSRPK